MSINPNFWQGIPSGVRDGILFLTAIGLLVYEIAIRDGPERPTVLLLLGGLLGAPAFLRGDERREKRADVESDA